MHDRFNESDNEDDENKERSKDSESNKDQKTDLIELVHQANTLVDQLNSLYNLYFCGAEKLPPLEKATQLNTLMKRLQATQKTTPANAFRYQSLLAKFTLYKNRWEKQIKDLEDGKMKKKILQS